MVELQPGGNLKPLFPFKGSEHTDIKKKQKKKTRRNSHGNTRVIQNDRLLRLNTRVRSRGAEINRLHLSSCTCRLRKTRTCGAATFLSTTKVKQMDPWKYVGPLHLKRNKIYSSDACVPARAHARTHAYIYMRRKSRWRSDPKVLSLRRFA